MTAVECWFAGSGVQAVLDDRMTFQAILTPEEIDQAEKQRQVFFGHARRGQ